MKKEYLYWLLVAMFLLLPFTATAYQVDQVQTLANGSLSAAAYPPVGQSFVPQQEQIAGVTLKLYDAGGAGAGNWTKIRLREAAPDGQVIAVSQELYLEDCAETDIDCSIRDGNSAEITFLFDQPVPLTVGATYVMELVVDSFGDGVSIACYTGDAYPYGGYYAEGKSHVDDLWFRTLAPMEP